MQTTPVYLDRRNYFILALVVVVALAAASVGRWVIPSAGTDGTATLVGNRDSAVPAAIESRLANFKQDQLDSQDTQAGFGGYPAPETSFEDLHPERAAIIEQARQSSSEIAGTNAERLAGLKQAQLDGQDRADGIGH